MQNEPQSWYGHFGTETNLLPMPTNELHSLGHVTHSLTSTLAELSQSTPNVILHDMQWVTLPSCAS
jgi:hypothetical protein